MTDLSDLVPALKRELAVPGEFDALFPNTQDTDLEDALNDGFAEAQLQGFFSTLTVTDSQTSEDLSAAGQALVTIFTGMRILRAHIRSLSTNERYKAGPVEIETSQAVSVLRDELIFMRARLDDLISNARQSGRGVHVSDGYVGRALAGSTLGGFYAYEWK